MAIIRVSEPYFQFLIKKQFKSFFGILIDEKEAQKNEQYINDTLVTFLTSSLNVELVHIILKSITKHCSGIVPSGSNKLSYNKNDFTAKYKFTIDSIKIKNPDEWKVAKLPQFLA